MFSSVSSALRGAACSLSSSGVVACGITVGAFVVLFAAFAVDSVVEAVVAFRSDKGGAVAGHVVLSRSRSPPASSHWPGPASRRWSEQMADR